MGELKQADFIEIVKRHLPAFFAGARVIEMGSLDINGSVRGHFSGGTYVGVDLAPGPGVDLVSGAHEIDHPDGSYDVAISSDCFEHNPCWLETFRNMLRLTREGGLVLFTCASTGYREHGTRRSAPEASPLTIAAGWDYYLNLTEADFTRRLDLRRWCSDYAFVADYESYRLCFVGRRGEKGASPLPPLLVPNLNERFNVWGSARAMKRRVKVALFGNFLSSPLSYYFLGKR